ncbi:glycoside hydrolase 43 family protein [Glycomyces paridis]|uniref:Glycosyl hydrolase 43 family protein n=1 Tax=Glycomyces paridis TaxID=2126555 RepID=A0A4S8P0V9_9ACTN|nr:glycoside hydrolase 43 family protein [Glycomyces paridis]THV21244.1 glycosyl hydrolase 43 family protein [Glycomyces paridis]
MQHFSSDNGDGTYRNPVLHADWSDPDAIRVGADHYMTASSFHRVPGLPILHSRDLVNWTIIGHALARLEPEADFRTPQRGGGVWAPALRHHAGRFWIVYPDPDRGLFVTSAEDPGPDGGRELVWTRPHLLKGGKGLIDPCPLWDDDGTAYLVHGWAKSRAGINNRLTVHRMNADATALLDGGTVAIDGDVLPGYRTLEGPKFYKRDGWYWIFAPAGGVADGWQSAFRSRSPFGPYEGRIVLAQGGTDVNGPHQGAWTTTEDGADWFLHFQDKGPYGRVVHLQPMRWDEDGWPEIGDKGTPVAMHAKPSGDGPVCAPDTADDFATGIGPQWSWQANPEPEWADVDAGLRLACVPGDGDLRHAPNLLGQRLPAERFAAYTELRLEGGPGARAGLAVVGDTFAWIGLERNEDGADLVLRVFDGDKEAELAREPAGDAAHLGVDVDAGGACRFLTGATPRRVGPVFTATEGRWVGATLGLFASTSDSQGSALFGAVRVAEGRSGDYEC